MFVAAVLIHPPGTSAVFTIHTQHLSSIRMSTILASHHNENLFRLLNARRNALPLVKAKKEKKKCVLSVAQWRSVWCDRCLKRLEAGKR
jgi:hypothetical protein